MKIKNCPFCGKNNVVVDVVWPNDDGGGYGIACLEGGCMGDIFRHNDFYGTEKEAIKAWNKRKTAFISNTKCSCLFDANHNCVEVCEKCQPIKKPIN